MTQHFIDDLEIHIPVIEFIEAIVTDRFREAPAGFVCGRLFLAAAINAPFAEREAALALPRALQEARRAILTGGEVKVILADSKKAILDAGFTNVDYLTLVDATTLVEIDMVSQQPLRLLAAAKIGKTRLIDNLAVG